MAMAMAMAMARETVGMETQPETLPQRQPEKRLATVRCSRRSSMSFVAVTVAAAAAAAAPVGIGMEEPAQAFSLGISGPKNWLKEQKKRTADFLLTPIARSRERLNNAFLLLTGSDTKENYVEAGNLVRVASRDCIPLEAGSVLDMQSRTGVEVCTFRLIVKNAASLLDDTDPTKVKAYLALENLIRSFEALDDSLAANSSSLSPIRGKIGDAFSGTYSALDEFEAGIRACLGIA